MPTRNATHTNVQSSRHQAHRLAARRRRADGGSNLGRFGVLLLAVRCLWRQYDSDGKGDDGADTFHDRLFSNLCQVDHRAG